MHISLITVSAAKVEQEKNFTAHWISSKCRENVCNFCLKAVYVTFLIQLLLFMVYTSVGQITLYYQLYGFT